MRKKVENKIKKSKASLDHFSSEFNKMLKTAQSRFLLGNKNLQSNMDYLARNILSVRLLISMAEKLLHRGGKSNIEQAIKLLDGHFTPRSEIERNFDGTVSRYPDSNNWSNKIQEKIEQTSRILNNPQTEEKINQIQNFSIGVFLITAMLIPVVHTNNANAATFIHIHCECGISEVIAETSSCTLLTLASQRLNKDQIQTAVCKQCIPQPILPRSNSTVTVLTELEFQLPTPTPTPPTPPSEPEHLTPGPLPSSGY